MMAPSSAQPLMANPFTRAKGQLLFTWCLAGVALEDLTSSDKLKLDYKGLLSVHRMMMQHFARDDSRLRLDRRKDAT